MKKIIPTGNYVFFILLLIVILAGCATKFNTNLNSFLNTEFLNDKTSTSIINLGESGKCPTVTLMVNPVNAETRSGKFFFDQGSVLSAYIDPKEYIEDVVIYLKKKLIQSNLKVDEKYGKKIFVSLIDMKAYGSMTFEATVKLKIELPEIGYSQVYSGTEGGPFANYAISYALNIALNNFLNDTVFQNYVKCRS